MEGPRATDLVQLRIRWGSERGDSEFPRKDRPAISIFVQIHAQGIWGLGQPAHSRAGTLDCPARSRRGGISAAGALVVGSPDRHPLALYGGITAGIPAGASCCHSLEA